MHILKHEIRMSLTSKGLVQPWEKVDLLTLHINFPQMAQYIPFIKQVLYLHLICQLMHRDHLHSIQLILLQ